jgi:FMN-dependent NADH-azoreductase
VSAEEAAGATSSVGDEWVEVYRGARRRGQVIIRVLTDASIPSRDARRLGLAAAKPQDGIVQVPKDRVAEAVSMIELLKKNFPVLFAAGPVKSE